MRYGRQLLALLLGAASLPATAAPDPLARITALGDQAQGACERYRFNEAKRLLDEALGLTRAARLEASPAAAKLYLLLGIVHVAGSDDTYRGLDDFVRTLRLVPTLALPASLATPQLNTVYEEACRTMKRVVAYPVITWQDQRAQPDPLAVAARAGERGLLHAPLTTAKRGEPLLLAVAAGLDVPAYRVFAYYRLPETVPFTRQPMRKRKGVFQAALPTNATRGRYVHYYIEAHDQRGRLAGSYGSAASPVVVLTE